MRKDTRVIKMRDKDCDTYSSGLHTPVSVTTSEAQAPSTLMRIQKSVMHFASLLASVILLEVEVVDSQLRRVAGTGVYGLRLGELPDENTILLQRVINDRAEIVIFDSRKNILCQQCHQRERCRERGFIGVPIIYQQECLGVISLVAVNNEQLRHLRENTRMFIEYIKHISTLIADNILMFDRKKKHIDPQIEFISQFIDQGIILFDENNHALSVNDIARRQLNISEEFVVSSLILENSFVDEDSEQAFCLQLAEEYRKVVGVWRRGETCSVLILSRNQMEPSDESAKENAFRYLVGHSSGIQQLKALIARIAVSPSSVMLLGESGTGKEVVAHTIHRLSDRRDKPFIAINCAAIPENLLESELFGYVKGAFTGASPAGKKGLIELANDGTLFLDEIGDMPLPLQARLLRAIETREIMPVGASQTVAVNIRIISATHQNLLEKITSGAFREDLYYRLNVIPLTIPPLRERDGDILLLLNYFLDRHSRRIGRRLAGISPAVKEMLQRYNWPGNVRELSNLAEYLTNIVADGGVIDSSLLPPLFHAFQNDHKKPQQRTLMAVTGDAPPGAAEEAAADLKSVEKSMIEEALHRTRNKKQVAGELGIGVATLYRKIKKYGL